MTDTALTTEQKKGIKIIIAVQLLIPVVFLIVLLTGRAITLFGTTTMSSIYSVAIYIPVFVLSLLALRKVRQR